MAKIAIHLTVEELQALLTLADNQFFRMKYIDPKIPGHKERPEELRAAQSAVQVFASAHMVRTELLPLLLQRPPGRPQL